LDRGFEEGAAAVKWDQFEENERKFGIILDGYNESDYTVPLDTNSPDFEERKRRAEALALEIRSGRAGCRNVHIREELDLPPIGGTVDEETLYSTVNAPSSTNMLRLGLRTDEEGSAMEAVSEEKNMREETADSEGPVEEWKLDLDAPEYEPLQGGLAALPDEVKNLLPFIADMLAPSLQRILVDSGLVPACVLEENREDMASRTLDDDTVPLTNVGHGVGKGPHSARRAGPGPASDGAEASPDTVGPAAVAGAVDQIGTRGAALRVQPRPAPQKRGLGPGLQQHRSSTRGTSPHQHSRHDGGRLCAAAAGPAPAASGGDGGLHGVAADTAAAAAVSDGGSSAGRISWASIVRAGAVAGMAATSSSRVQ
jgi:hypothetical protein